MNTSLNEIKKENFPEYIWERILKAFGKKEADDEPIDFKYILEKLTIEDAVWCLTSKDYRDYCLFNADVAELSLKFFWNRYSSCFSPQETIQSIRDFQKGLIGIDEIEVPEDLSDVMEIEHQEISAIATAAIISPVILVNASVDYAVNCYGERIRENQWRSIKNIFIKNFCE